jgi:hypothetical protein
VHLRRIGDSYVVGLIAEYPTNHKCRCYNPSDQSNSIFLQDKTYSFISATGRTRVYIETARRATESVIWAVVVTLKENSKLVKVCKQVVPLNLTKAYTSNAGNGFMFSIIEIL